MKSRKLSPNPRKIYWYILSIVIALIVVLAIFFLLKGSSSSVSYVGRDSPLTRQLDGNTDDSLSTLPLEDDVTGAGAGSAQSP